MDKEEDSRPVVRQWLSELCFYRGGVLGNDFRPDNSRPPSITCLPTCREGEVMDPFIVELIKQQEMERKLKPEILPFDSVTSDRVRINAELLNQPSLEVNDEGGLSFTKVIPDFQQVTVRGNEASGEKTAMSSSPVVRRRWFSDDCFCKGNLEDVVPLEDGTVPPSSKNLPLDFPYRLKENERIHLPFDSVTSDRLRINEELLNQPSLEVNDEGGISFTKVIPDFQQVTVRGNEASGKISAHDKSILLRRGLSNRCFARDIHVPDLRKNVEQSAAASSACPMINQEPLKQPSLDVNDEGGLCFTKMISDLQQVTVRGNEASGVLPEDVGLASESVVKAPKIRQKTTSRYLQQLAGAGSASNNPSVMQATAKDPYDMEILGNSGYQFQMAGETMQVYSDSNSLENGNFINRPAPDGPLQSNIGLCHTSQETARLEITSTDPTFECSATKLS